LDYFSAFCQNSILHANLLNNFPSIRTADPSEAAERWRTTFGAAEVETRSERDKFALIVNDLQLTELGLAFIATGGHVSASFPATTFVRQLFNMEGHGRLSYGAQHVEELQNGSWSSVVPAGTPCRVKFEPNDSQVVIRIEVAALYRYLSALTGEETTRELVFAQSIEGNPAMYSLKARVLQFASDYNARGYHFSQLAQAEMQRMIIMKFLLCHRHSYTDLLLRDPIPLTSNAVKLAEEFLEANWNKPIDIAAVARVANVSARSLFRSFRKELGQSPAEYLKELRLRSALIILENPNPDTTVTQVALTCGFLNGGHFAHDYQIKFGELPSETLNRGRRK
jgi:AraC-like DNA-binding protein